MAEITINELEDLETKLAGLELTDAQRVFLAALGGTDVDAIDEFQRLSGRIIHYPARPDSSCADALDYRGAPNIALTWRPG